ncbi:MAG: signal peptidase I [Butyrivibrio sp.]|uniref:signal peptidase I n=1 Tax=Butyrivibrio sp. TaxID=28121 RepID=UPI001B53CEA3|nr:signal peptidase I [Butyrivibrio sp.]MBP3784494.1 signal peptidase I [Butyrivibrio sp.]
MSKKIISLIMIFMMFLSFPVVSMAEDKVTGDGEQVIKEVSVSIPDNYAECTFTLQYENEEFAPDNVELFSPNKKAYGFTTDSVSGAVSCTVQNVTAGEWTVKATKMFPASAEKKEICKITVSVKSSNSAAKDVTGDISLSKEISGLSYYWKDDNIVVTWTDESVGNVDVTVTDSKTLKILGNEKVKQMYYECPVGDSVDEIILSVVPATSSGISGAEVTYVIRNNYNPDAQIVFDSSEYINTATRHGIATVGEQYTLKYVDNGNIVGASGKLEVGDNDFEVPVTEGDNNVIVYVVDDDGNMKSFTDFVIVDTVPPILKIEDDISGTSTYNNSISFSGNVSDFETLYNGTQEVEVDERGYFDVTATLREGNNEITLVATDKAGNNATYTAYVEMLVKKAPAIGPIQIAGIVLLVIALILLVVFIIKKRNGGDGGSKKGKKIPHFEEDEEEEVEDKRKAKETKKSEPIIDKGMLFCSIIILAGCLFLSIFVVQFTHVESGSMEPTIMTDEFTIVNKLAYMTKEPQRGDIIAFKSEEYNRYLLKRIIGVPGDEIEFHDGYVYINGLICDESAYLDEDIETNCDKSFTVPDGSYFVMGDNREHSTDSRFFKSPYVLKDDIMGRVFYHFSFG